MLHVRVTTRSGQEQVIRAQPGRSLMEVIRDAGIDDIEAICGGTCSCSTCHVYIGSEDLGRLPPMAEAERAMLSGAAPQPGSRLACQIQFSDALDGIRVTIAP